MPKEHSEKWKTCGFTRDRKSKNRCPCIDNVFFQGVHCLPTERLKVYLNIICKAAYMHCQVLQFDKANALFKSEGKDSHVNVWISKVSVMTLI